VNKEIRSRDNAFAWQAVRSHYSSPAQQAAV
jgi:hypothetical protein